MAADTKAARAEIKKRLRVEEGERFKPYRCPAGVPTIGVGCTTYMDGRPVRMGDPEIDADQSERLLDHKVTEGMREVWETTRGNVTTNQLVALVLCGFNIGWRGLRSSTIIKQHNLGNYAAAGRAFRLWNKYRPKPGAPLQVHPVLDARRAREAAIYASGVVEPGTTPQAVAPESKPTAGPIAASGATVTVAGAASVLSENVSSVKGAADVVKSFVVNTLGIPPEWVLPALMIAAGVAVMYWRSKQRSEGWA